MKKTNWVFFVSLLLLSSNCFSQEAAQKNILMSRSEAFLQAVIDGNVVKAYTDGFQGTSIMTEKPQALKNGESQLQAMLNLYGSKFVGYEFVSQKNYGTSVVRLVYFLKLETNPLIWNFYYYRANGTWVLNSVNFNDDIKVLDSK